MLGRKDYTRGELERARTTVVAQLMAWRSLAAAHPSADVEVVYFNAMTLALDRSFVHRSRAVTGKDGNPLNELELIAESLLDNDGVMRGSNVIRYIPGAAVVRLRPGDPIRLTANDFERLSTAVLAELEARFVTG